MTSQIKRMAIGSDHAGYRYKQEIIKHLKAKGLEVIDFGTDSEESVDYPKFIRPTAEAVAAGKADAGIVLGGSGNGEQMVANKVKGIRCALCWNEQTARLAKEHNNANVISIGERTISLETALLVVDTWMIAEFQGGRHERRIAQIEGE
ncbi:MAG TPA: ribose 5-phosphate isomerase B [candidate division Zixibacteria bacterium]|nr:ribose 5-phosphate isomerase B [candidate division Zixibacteria bacterium]